MSLPLALAGFVAGLALVVYFAERLVEGVVETSLVLGLTPFLVTVIFVGFDPENLAVGAVASFEGSAGIALGSILGSAMVAIALAFGVTALIVPMRFERAPATVLAVPLLAAALLAVLALDGMLSRLDGALLLGAYGVAVAALLRAGRRGLRLEPSGEVAEVLEEDAEGDAPGPLRALGLLILSLAAILLGSELIVESARAILPRLGLSETVFGMTALALLVSVEELARELPAALKGRPDITYGNVAGSILAFFLFNAGVIALVRPVPLDEATLHLYLPVTLATVLLVTLFMLRKRVPRWAGALLLLVYGGFFLAGYV